MSRFLCRISMLLIVSLAASACVPTSRAQGLDPTPRAVSASASDPNTLAAPISLFQPYVARVAQAEPAPVDETSAPRVWFDVSLQPQLVDLFNVRATPNDIARIEHVSMLDLLDEVTVGRKLVIFKNAVDAEEAVPLLADEFDIIGYNLEGGPSNLPEEQADPVGSAQRVRALADAYGLQVALGPSRDFVLNYGAEMAPYVDIFVLQVQRVQTEHDTVREFVLPVTEMLLAANPDLEISVQIRTEGNPDELIALLESLGPNLAGVSILTSQETVPTANALYAALDEWRWRAVETRGASPTPVESSGTPTVDEAESPTPAPGVIRTATPSQEPRRTPAPEGPPARPTSGDGPGGGDGPTRWLLFGSGLLFGVLVSMLAGTWIAYAYQRTRVR